MRWIFLQHVLKNHFSIENYRLPRIFSGYLPSLRQNL
ncbi:hypothetical protein EG68_03122 [Paragonimus skrjabini miyazakii]|uniref:Uncharacterized protein n=1 Tax=Paragonimus skrjabini miyazakii TaxID=59628 RepID=A0A8S9YWP8_9TREM|nr:hypothetical protein EG68_03122 [Paragonimus skrjabini miyazakii]